MIMMMISEAAAGSSGDPETAVMLSDRSLMPH